MLTEVEGGAVQAARCRVIKNGRAFADTAQSDREEVRHRQEDQDGDKFQTGTETLTVYFRTDGFSRRCATAAIWEQGTTGGNGHGR